MSLLCSFNCCDTIFDVYSSERVPVGLTKNKYYITPKRLALIEAWMIRSNVDKIISKDMIEHLINNKLITEYHG